MFTLVIAGPVIVAQGERLFGIESVGRHHDPFTVMEQFERPFRLTAYSQPLTDMPGVLLARVSGGVAAYNWLVLLSFPLSAAAAFALARHLTLSMFGASVAAIAFAFSPFHLAHAAYHPHVAQTQWVPLYLLMLWRYLDRPTAMAVVLLMSSAIVATLSNFYGGLIVAVVTPAAAAAYWCVLRRGDVRPIRTVSVAIGSLATVAVGGVAYVAYAAPTLIANPGAFAFPRADLFLYSAKWWSYLVPPIGHPWLGASAYQFWAEAGVREGLLEQQVTLGWGVIALATVAIGGWLVRVQQPAVSRVPVLVIVALVALVCSLSPERTVWGITFVRPSALLYEIAPMFRAYARFGVVVQLMAVLLAGIGADYLRRSGVRWLRIAGVVLLALAGSEYIVAPSAQSRDVLPTGAHRWFMQQPGGWRAFDCAPLDSTSRSVEWLTQGRITAGTAASDCTEPNLAAELAARGFTHLIVRRDTDDGQWLVARQPADGLRLVADQIDGRVFAVAPPALSVHISARRGFFALEHNDEWSWRWMGARAAWTVVNPGPTPVLTSLDVEMSALHPTSRIEFRIDGDVKHTAVVEPGRRNYRIGPFMLAAGQHELALHALEVPMSANDLLRNGDSRELSVAIGTWQWKTVEDR